MHWTRFDGPRWAVGLLLLLGLAAVPQAIAVPPPPPSFYNFTITNQLPGDVTGLQVEFYKTQGVHHDAIDPAPVTMNMSAVPSGAEMVISLKQTYGIAKIVVQARCPGSPTPKTVEITAPLGDHDVPPDGQLEYACFCYQAPPGQSNYTPRLEFKNSAGQDVIHLHARARWKTFWCPPKEALQPCR